MRKLRYSALLVFILMPLFPAHAAGGTLYITPASGVYEVGHPFSIEVLADTGGEAVNAVEAELAYNPGDFAVINISTAQSILTSWSTPPSYDGAAGVIQFSGWAGGNYTGSNGLLITIELKPLRVAQSIISFNSGAMLAASDASNIITTMTSGSYALSPEQVTPPAPAIPTSSTPVAPPQTPNTPAPQPPAGTQSSDQAAALLSSGVTLAPVIVGFFAALALIAFCIAYILHRKGMR